MIWIVLGGFLANISWQDNYYVYGITLVAWILALLFVPNLHPKGTATTATFGGAAYQKTVGLNY